MGGQSGTGNDGEFAHELRIARHRAYPKHGSSRFGTVESDLRTVEHRLRRGEPQVARRYERRGSQRNPAPVAPEITREVHGHRLSGPHIDGGSPLDGKQQFQGVDTASAHFILIDGHIGNRTQLPVLRAGEAVVDAVNGTQ